MKAFKKELNNVAQYTKQLFEKYDRPNLTYHNFDHTKSVVKYATQIANHYRLSEEEYYTLIAAAWLHDVGFYINEEGTEHEAASAHIATAYLKEEGLPDTVIEK